MATWPTITDDDGTGTTGTILDQALFNQVRDYVGAAHTTVTYAAGNFTAQVGSWTVDNADETVKFVEIGKTMIVTVDIRTSTVTSTPIYLRMAIPNGRTAQGVNTGTFAYSNNGTVGTGWWQTDATASFIDFYLSFATPTWATATNATAVLGQMIIQIN